MEESETGGMWPQAMEAQAPPEPLKAEEARKIPPWALEGVQLCPHLEFRFLASGTGKDDVFVVFSHAVCVNLSQ